MDPFQIGPPSQPYYQTHQDFFHQTLASSSVSRPGYVPISSISENVPSHTSAYFQQPISHDSINIYGSNWSQNNHMVDSLGTIIIPCDSEIQEVTMIDDCDSSHDPSAISFFASLDDKLSRSFTQEVNEPPNFLNDEQEYWRNTHDCDYRFKSLSVDQPSETATDIPEFNTEPKNTVKRKLCRKKAKKLAKKTEGIDLTRIKESGHGDPVADFLNSDLEIDIATIDKLDINKLILYYNKLKEELTVLNSENQIDKPTNDGADDSVQSNEFVKNQSYENISESNLVGHQEQEFEAISDSDVNLMTNEEPVESVKSKDETQTKENLLREQLIRTLLEKRFSKICQKGTSESRMSIQDKSINEMKLTHVENFNENTAPKIDLSQYNLVIQISHSESEEDSETESKNPHFQSNTDEPLTEVSEQLPQLYKSQLIEYEKLRKEIERREGNYKLKNLQNYEIKYQHTMKSLGHTRKKANMLKKKINLMKKQLKNSKSRAIKLKNLYMIAEKNVHVETLQLKAVMEQLQNLEESLIKDQESVEQYKNLCYGVGQKLYGDQYNLPRIQSPLTTVTNRKQKLNQSNKQVIKSSVISSYNNEKTRQIQSSKINLRHKIQTLLQHSYSSDTVRLLEHCMNLNFDIFECTLFIQSNNSMSFSDFTSSRSYEELNEFPIGTCQKIKYQDLISNQYQSVLFHFNSYRFNRISEEDISSDFWSNMLNPNKVLCPYDLMGSCNDSKCQYQHRKDYILGKQEKILDLLTYIKEFCNSINLEELKKNPKLIQEKLNLYLRQKKISLDIPLETICQKISKQLPVSVASLLLRLIPKELIKFSENHLSNQTKVPFQDHIYRFDVRDEQFDLKLSQFVNFTLENDPDIYIKNRFFAPEGVPFSAQLESSLSNDPHNIQMWINLAYYHLSKSVKTQDNLDYCFDSALNVLSRALEHNSDNSELYEHYLLIYVNKYDRFLDDSNSKKDQKILEIQDICRRILKYCSTYRLWISYLNLCYAIEEKHSISLEIIDQYVQNKIQYSSDEERSFNLLEIIFYRINLLLHQNRYEESFKFFIDIFNKTSSQPDLETNDVCSLILPKHRSFAWHCYIHLILYRSLPFHCFQLTKRGCFLRLIDTQTFIFDWKDGSSVNDLRLIKNIFKRALKNCCSDDILKCSCTDNQTNPMETCFSLRLNLTNLNKLLVRYSSDPTREDEDSRYLFPFNENCEMLTNLHIMNMFKINLGDEWKATQNDLANDDMLNLIEKSHNSNVREEYVFSKMEVQFTKKMFDVLENQLKFNYWLAFYQYKMKNFTKSKGTLVKNLSYYFKETPVSIESGEQNILRLFEIILFDSLENNEWFMIDLIKYKLRFKNDKRAHHSVHLYLSYMLYTHICLIQNPNIDSDQHYLKLDCVFSSVINSFLSLNPQADVCLTKILWFNYFVLLLDFQYSDSHFKIVYENLRHIALNFNHTDPILVYHLINALSEFINLQDRLYFLVDLSELIPENINLVLKVFNMALQQDRKKTLWNLIMEIVYKKKIRLQCLEFWKIAISLSVERNDHLNTHKFFQISISLMPYNTVLWEMFKSYETSINHQEHLNQIQSFYAETLRMDTASTNSNT